MRVVWVLLTLAGAAAAQDLTYHRDIRPILEKRCVECHRTGQIGPMPLTTYGEVRPWARAIREAASTRKMPPWFADRRFGRFANDRSLTRAEVETLTRWVDSGTAEGIPSAPASVVRDGWNLPRVDAILRMPKPFAVPASEDVDYQYFVAEARFPEDRWVRGVEVRPNARSVVHHAVVYVRPAGDTWTGGPTTNDILTVYAPGSPPDMFAEGMAKLIPAGADLVFEVHYTPDGRAREDQIEVGVLWSERPAKRVITLQMASTDFVIPPRARAHRVTVQGTLPNDALLLGMFPHMHLRGSEFEYNIVTPEGRSETLLRVAPYNFHWQLSYRLAEPMPLKKGTRLSWVATYDNSANNRLNPNPAAEVRYGLQSWQEMMVGFFDVAVDAGISKEQFFVR